MSALTQSPENSLWVECMTPPLGTFCVELNLLVPVVNFLFFSENILEYYILYFHCNVCVVSASTELQNLSTRCTKFLDPSFLIPVKTHVFFLHPHPPGNARAVGSAAADLQHHQVGAEEEPAGRSGCAQVLRLYRQRQAEIPQLLIFRCVCHICFGFPPFCVDACFVYVCAPCVQMCLQPVRNVSNSSGFGRRACLFNKSGRQKRATIAKLSQEYWGIFYSQASWLCLVSTNPLLSLPADKDAQLVSEVLLFLYAHVHPGSWDSQLPLSVLLSRSTNQRFVTWVT